MNEPIALRLYEEAARNAGQSAAYKPGDDADWNAAVGDDLGLEDPFGGYCLGTILRMDPQVRTDAAGARYRIATVIPKD